MPGLDVQVPYFLQNTNEQPIPEESSIIGHLPSYVRGTVLAVAPGIFDLPHGSFNHWLDGLALLHRFEVTESSVKFSKRFVQSDAYKKAIKAGKPCSVEVGTNPSTKGLLSKLKPFGPYDLSDNCVNGSIYKLGPKQTLLMSDSSFFYQIKSDSLETLEKHHSVKTFGVSGLSPYPIKDPRTGDLYNVGTAMTGASLKYHVVRMKAEKESEVLENKFETICTIPSRWFSCISLIRCFGVSENYMVFVEQPVVINGVKLAATNMRGFTARDWLDWKNELNRFYLIEKRTGKLLKTEVYSENPFHSLVVLNCFEDQHLLIFDCVTASSFDTIDRCFLNNVRQLSSKSEGQLSNITRFIIPLNTLVTEDIKNVPENTNLLDEMNINFNSAKAKAVRKGNAIYLSPEKLVDDPEAGIDFGQINELYKGKKYSYFFATPGLCSISSKYFGKLCKVNVDTGDVKTWKPDNNDDKDGYMVSNPLFVPNEDDGDGDDDGVLISTITTVRKGDKNFLVFIDGKSFVEIGRCYFEEKIGFWVSPSFIK